MEVLTSCPLLILSLFNELKESPSGKIILLLAYHTIFK